MWIVDVLICYVHLFFYVNSHHMVGIQICPMGGGGESGGEEAAGREINVFVKSKLLRESPRLKIIKSEIP